jgi:hypothetical protein
VTWTLHRHRILSRLLLFWYLQVEQTEMENLEAKLLEEVRGNVKRLDRKQLEQKRMEELLIPNSGKMVLLDKLLPKLRNENHKVSGLT